jgi:hypothetical protein
MLVINASQPLRLKIDEFQKNDLQYKLRLLYLHSPNAKVAQLVELQPSKLVVASSSLVFRSIKGCPVGQPFFVSNNSNSHTDYLPHYFIFHQNIIFDVFGHLDIQRPNSTFVNQSIIQKKQTTHIA